MAVLLSIPTLNVGGGEPFASGSATAGHSHKGGGLNLSIPVPAILNISPTGTPLSSELWGTTVSPRAPLLADEGALVNSTPTQVIVWPGADAGDDYDPVTNIMYNPTSAPAASTPPTSEAEFVSWCDSIHCKAIFQVPGEINDPAIAQKIVEYTEDPSPEGLDFRPVAWEIGNEPEHWGLWNEPWSAWPYKGPTIPGPTPTQYAYEVQNYTAAMQAVAPPNTTIPIIGLPGTGRPNVAANVTYDLTDWVEKTVEVNHGPNLVGVAFHEYPAPGGASAGNLSMFYSMIESTSGLPARVNSAASAIDSACPNCANPIAVYITELGSALSHGGYLTDSAGFPGALDLAAQSIQAIDLNVTENLTNVDLYGTVANTSNSWFGLSGTPRPDYTMYSDILSRLGNVAYLANLTTSYSCTEPYVTLQCELFAVVTTDPSHDGRVDLLALNLNLTTPVTFDKSALLLPKTLGITATTPFDQRQWTGQVVDPTGGDLETAVPATPTPLSTFYPGGLPGNVTLPPQSVTLLEAYPLSPSGAGPVDFEEAGLNLTNSSRWFLSVNGSEQTANGSNQIQYFLPAGRDNVTAPAVFLSNAIAEQNPRERFLPAPPVSIEVNDTNQTFLVPFAQQWGINISANPEYGGIVLPSPGWGNVSQQFVLDPVPAAGYTFNRWSGSGPGSLNGTESPGVIWTNGSIIEKALFSNGYPVDFDETGLPMGVPWIITVRGAEFASDSPSLNLTEANGTFGYSVGEIGGFRSMPTNSSFTVAGGAVTVVIAFIRLTPPAPRYLVTFAESGLPNGTPWAVTVRNVTEYSTTTMADLTESNGTYGLLTFPIPGYRLSPPVYTYYVNGSSERVALTFAPVLYAVHWEESGLGSGLNWSVLVNGISTASEGSWTTALLANGTYPYSLPNSAAFVPVPRGGAVVVNGSSIVIPVVFTRPTFPVTFEATGLPRGTSWSVTVRGEIESSSTGNVTFQEMNGSYGYQAHPVPGYRPQLTDAVFQVNGSPLRIPVEFAPVLYAVNWEESGLSKNTNWSVVVNGISTPSNGSSTTTDLANGSYSFVVPRVGEFVDSPFTGTLLVDGASIVVPVQFTHITVRVVFEETGLSTDTNWSVTVTNVTESSTTNSLTFLKAEGTFGFSVGAVPGFRSDPTHSSFRVVGGSVVVSVTFVALTPPAVRYPVIFTETGLPVGTEWSITVRTSTVFSAMNNLSFVEPEGKFGYSVSPVAGFQSAPTNDSFVVDGPTGVAITFHRLPPAPTQYQVTFVEGGLPTGTAWEITIRNETRSSSTTTLTLSEANQTFGYSVSEVPAFRSDPTRSSFVVDGVPVVVPIAFVRLTPRAPEYLVTFQESGLPNGTRWGITFLNVTETAPTPTVNFSAANGSHGYHALPVPGFRAHPAASEFEVLGANVVVPVVFSPVLFSVVWEETGLGANLSWSVSAQGTTTPARGSWTTVDVPNGTYPYKVLRAADYVAEPRAGTVVVNGSNLVIPVQYSRATFPVMFTTTGSGSQATWRVRLSDVLQNVTTSTAGFHEPNGTYSFNVVAPTGMHATPSHGLITVNATPIVILIGVQPNGPGPLPSLTSLGRPALTAVAIMGLAGWGAFAILRSTHRRTKAGTP
ncbi:MAG: hypothetical protein L3K03_04885 [Thermoplasmata archaeon]|nr:hypothetical protein [Thermoplasmata archaeon]